MASSHRTHDLDAAVSPVIAVILMTAITVVVAATLYLWTTGFQSEQHQIVEASFVAKVVDLPWANTDADRGVDAIEVTLVAGVTDLQAEDVALSVDGVLLRWSAGLGMFLPGGASAANAYCATSPGADGDAAWERGASVFVTRSAAGVQASDLCDGAVASAAELASLKGPRSLALTVLGRGVYAATLDVLDDASQG